MPGLLSLLPLAGLLPGLLLIVPAAVAAPDPAPDPAPAPAQIPPSLLTDSPPVYPAAALAERAGGRVVLELQIDAQGVVQQAKIVQGVRPDLDDAALTAATGLRFSPATDQGVPVAAVVQFSYTFAPPEIAAAPDGGTIRVLALDVDELEIPGATLTLTMTVAGPDGAPQTVTQTHLTGDDGAVQVSGLAPGVWRAVIHKDSLRDVSLEVEVTAGGAKEARVLLLPIGSSGEVDVVADKPRFLDMEAPLAERQEAGTVSDVISAQMMSRAGDSDAASAMRRVTGLTVVGGRYVFVRGLGDRYSATTLNGSTLPSPEPERRVVPLDLFPTALLEAVVIQKTFSPDRPAEFGGGIVQIRTRSIPEEAFFQVQLSGTYVAGTSFTRQQVAGSGPTDMLGFGAGWRALDPEIAGSTSSIKPGGIFSEDGYTAEDIERFGERIPNRWELSERTLTPDIGFSITGGNRAQIGGATFGAVGGITFANGWDVEQGSRAVYANGTDGLQLKRSTDFLDLQNTVRLGAMLGLGLSWGEGREIRTTTLLNRNSAASSIVYDADDPTGSGDSRNTRTGWEEQQLFYQQITTRQPAGPLILEGRYAFAVASRLEPDRREYSYILTDDGYVLSQKGSWNEILYSTLQDRNHDLGLDISLPLTLAHGDRPDGEGRIAAGFNGVRRARDSTTRRFSYELRGTETFDLSRPISEIITGDNIGAEAADGVTDTAWLEFIEYTSSSDDYRATQALYAGYLLADLPVLSRLRLLGGARVEASTQIASTYELFDTSQTPVEASLSTVDLLPALTGSVAIGGAAAPEDMLLRLGYGRTLSRPEFRELSEVPWYDYRTGRQLYGNPDLQRATIDNFDVRWEWYPRAGETLSIGGFAKLFHDPIESVIAVSAVSGSVGTFDNATGATNLGTELEWRQGLGPLSIALSDFSIAGNAAFILSTIDLSGTDGNQTSSERPLQGQSPWVLNLQILYEHEQTGTGLSLLYNAFGPRISEVGQSGIPDTYELPVHRLDLTGSQRIAPAWSLKVKATNLLDWPARERTGTEIAEEVYEGWSAGLGISWSPQVARAPDTPDQTQ